MIRILELIALWNLYFLLNVFFAWWNVEIVRTRIMEGNTKQINHPLWGAFYCSLCAPQWFIVHDWFFLGSILSLHLSVFPVAYNRDFGFPAFNLSRTSKAITDRLQIWIGLKTSALVNILGFTISLGFLIKSFL